MKSIQILSVVNARSIGTCLVIGFAAAASAQEQIAINPLSEEEKRTFLLVDEGQPGRPPQLVDIQTGEAVERDQLVINELAGLDEARYSVMGTDGWYLANVGTNDHPLYHSGLTQTHPQLRRTEGKPDIRLSLEGEAWLHNDLVRIVGITDGGDYYRGTIDWSNGSITDIKQLTDLGVFTHKPPFLWAADHLYIWGEFDKQRPTVRLNLNTGEYEEVDWFDALPRRGPAQAALWTNPSRTIAFALRGDQIRVIDLVRGRTLRIPLDDEPELTRENGPNNILVTARAWLDDHTLVSTGIDFCTRLDLKSGKVTVTRWGEIFPDHIHHYMPGTRTEAFIEPAVIPLAGFRLFGHMFPVEVSVGRQDKSDHFVLDLRDLSKRPIKIKPAERRAWLTPTQYLYSNSDGGLSNIGTYLFDTATGQSTRVSRYPMDKNTGLHRVPNEEFFVLERAGRTSKTAYIVSFDGETHREIASAYHSIEVVMGNMGNVPAIDLWFNKDLSEAWRPGRWESSIAEAGYEDPGVVRTRATAVDKQVDDSKRNAETDQQRMQNTEQPRERTAPSTTADSSTREQIEEAARERARQAEEEAKSRLRNLFR